MTVSSTTRKAGPFPGNGATVSFPFTFRVFSASDVLVVRADATGAETTLALTTDYTVSLNADQNASPGGTVMPVVVLATGLTLTLSSALDYLQPVDLTNNGGFYPAVINTALDRLTILCQQLAEKVSRGLKMAISTPAGVDPTLPVPVPYQLIGWNNAGTGFQNTDPTYSTALATDLASSSASKGSALVNWIQSGVGAVARLVRDKLRESVSTDDYPTFAAALTAIGSSNVTLNIITPVTLAANTTVPNNVTLRFHRGGSITQGANTLTINGDVKAGLYPIFSGAGTVTIVDGDRRAEWWGFARTASAATNAAAIQAAINSFPQIGGNPAFGGTVRLGRGAYPCAPDVITFLNKRNITLEGAGSAWGYDTPYYAPTLLDFTTGTVGIDVSDPTSFVTNFNTVKNIRIDGHSVLQDGIRISNQQTITGCSVEGCTLAGLRLKNATNSSLIEKSSFSFNTSGNGVWIDSQGGFSFTTVAAFNNCSMRANAGGIRAEVGAAIGFKDCVIESNVTYGLHVYRFTSPINAANSCLNFDFERCHFENNGTGGTFVYQVNFEVQAHGQANTISGMRFRTCSFGAGVNTQKYVRVDDAQSVEFINCFFTGSTQSDAHTFNATYAKQVSYTTDDLTNGAPTEAQIAASGAQVWIKSFKASLKTNEGITGATASGTPITLFTMPTTAASLVMYQVIAYLPAGGAVSYGANARIVSDGATARLMAAENTANLTITLSGMNVQATQSSGAPQGGIVWKYIKLG